MFSNKRLQTVSPNPFLPSLLHSPCGFHNGSRLTLLQYLVTNLSLLHLTLGVFGISFQALRFAPLPSCVLVIMIISVLFVNPLATPF